MANLSPRLLTATPFFDEKMVFLSCTQCFIGMNIKSVTILENRNGFGSKN